MLPASSQTRRQYSSCSIPNRAEAMTPASAPMAYPYAKPMTSYTACSTKLPDHGKARMYSNPPKISSRPNSKSCSP
jgi:hypothetical protein